MSDVFSQRLSHQWRTEEAAILVGYRTALHDNPQLTNRHWPGKPPLRIAVDRELQLPLTHHLLDDSTPAWLLNSLQEKTAGQTHYVSLDFQGDWITQLMDRLYAAGQLSLIVEGGAALLQQFIERELWDEARVITTPALLEDGIAAPVLPGATIMMQQSLHADHLDVYLPDAVIYPVGAAL